MASKPHPPNYKHRYPPQLKKSIAKKLIEEGLAQEIEISDHNLRLTCHQLTHKGFWVYGEWARAQEKCDCCLNRLPHHKTKARFPDLA